MTRKNLLIIFRLFFALMAMAALLTSVKDFIDRNIHLSYWFSFFTHLSNLFATIVLLLGAFNLIKKKDPGENADIVRGTSVVAITLVGLVFGVLLSGIENLEIIKWVNAVVHYIMPVVMVIDWLLLPPKVRLLPRHIWYWMIYPLVYVIYVMIRGSIDGFYPYWFFNPAKAPGGWGGVVLISLGMTAVFVLISFALIALGNKMKKSTDRVTSL